MDIRLFDSKKELISWPMYKVLKISYWLFAIMLIATIVTSLGYRFGEAVFIGTMFVPGSVVAKYFYPRLPFHVGNPFCRLISSGFIGPIWCRKMK